MAADGASSISVCVRVRPFTVREAAQLSHTPDGPLFLGDGSLAGAPTPKLSQKGIRSVIKVVDDKCLIFDPPEDNPVQRFSRSLVPNGRRTKDQTFGFDRIFDENVTQAEVYEATTRNVLDSVLDGYNATVFAYGATGCGKTHTITGTIQQPGIIFLTMQELFERIADRSEEKTTEVSLSYLEIYNETIRDLLVPGASKAGLMLREDANQAVSVAGLSSHHPQSVQEVMDMIVQGNELRTISPTEANATSSRSHAVLQINVSQKERNADVNEPHTMATLSIIDLAGSERASATKNRGERLLEGANINKSLLALGSCINALCDPRKKNHVPYRNSKLTRLLKFSLGGNCKTVMIVCVSPSSQHFDETQNTLRYANRAKNIQTKVTRNVFNVNRHVKDFLVKIDEQMALINELKQQQKDYEAIAFSKFRKQAERREALLREGLIRIRNAYDNSSAERLEKASNMRKLRQIERRILMIQAWMHAFDQVQDAAEDEDTLRNLFAVKKTAQGIVVELESSRHHYHHKVGKSNWERAIDSALQHALKQLKDGDGSLDASDAANLEREADALKASADREALISVAEQEKGSDASLVQVLLHAHFDTLVAVEGLLGMGEEEAIQAAKGTLSKILKSCSSATSHVVKPDGSIAPVELFPPTKLGTPKRKKQAVFDNGTPLKAPAIAALAANAPHLTQSPYRGSPKRRKMGGAKKGVAFTPTKKKSPIKGLKRGVRWRDDTEDGKLAEFEKTPQRHEESSPELPSSMHTASPLPRDDSAILMPPPQAFPDPRHSSPIPTPPLAHSEIKASKHNRFQTGFLSKKADGSPVAPTLTNPNLAFSSDTDTDNSPLRDLELNRVPSRSSLAHVVEGSHAHANSHDSTSNSDSEPPPYRTSSQPAWKADKAEALQIRKAMRRTSATSSSTAARDGATTRAQRRRSPTASHAAQGSPPHHHHDGGMFSASQARRMVRSEKENEWRAGVLSPRTGAAAVGKGSGQRRITVSGKEVAVGREGARGGGHAAAGSVVGGGGSMRGSLMPGGKGVWR